MESLSEARLSVARVLIVLFGAIALLATAPAHAKTFRWAYQSDVLTMDPHNSSETFSLGFLGNVYEGLVQRDKDLSILPALATEWSVVQPDVWRFKLRQGVKFHDGSDFTADDVIFSLERSRSAGSDVKPFVAGIKEIKKIDSHTIDIVTNGPQPVLLNSIALWYIVPKKWFEAHNAVEVARPIGSTPSQNHATFHANGTGPYKVKVREPDVRTVLAANLEWWAKRTGNVTEGTFTPISSGPTRVAALLAGELQMMYPVPLQDVARINATSGLRVLQNAELRTVFLGMDQGRDELLYSNVRGKNPFKDKRVRLAFYKAIDAGAIQQKIMRGASRPAALLIAPGISGYDAKLDIRFAYDPDEAKKLLAEAGYPNGFEVQFDCPNDRYVNDEAICQAIAVMLARIGITAKVNAQTKSSHFKRVTGKDTSFYLIAWTPGSLDMLETFAYHVSSKGDWNVVGYKNPQVDTLLKKIAVEMNPASRQELISEAMKMVRDDVAYLPIHQQALAWGTRTDIDLVQYPDDTFGLRWVTVK
ncbi:MAG: ABC transporter substrate-binding protein [Hyphomicrobiaceae bacterium]